MGLKWKFQRGGEGFKPKNLPWEGYGYFMEQHNTHLVVEIYIWFEFS